MENVIILILIRFSITQIDNKLILIWFIAWILGGTCMNRFITSKQHYKMYKKGRFWVFAGITVATFTLNPLISRADTETTTAATAATTTAGASSSSNSQVLRTTTTSTTGATTQSSATAINAATTNTSAQKNRRLVAPLLTQRLNNRLRQ